jgi:uncharacterized protein
MEFDWDEANLNKLNVINANRGIDRNEIESVFDDPFHIVRPNKYEGEKRFEAIGLSNRNRLVIVIFTIRNEKIRYVTAWQQSNQV